MTDEDEDRGDEESDVQINDEENTYDTEKDRYSLKKGTTSPYPTDLTNIFRAMSKRSGEHDDYDRGKIFKPSKFRFPSFWDLGKRFARHKSFRETEREDQ